MIGNREIAKVVHEVESALVRSQVAFDGEETVVPRWEEQTPEYQERRTAAVHAYKQDGTLDLDALDPIVFAAIVEALK